MLHRALCWTLAVLLTAMNVAGEGLHFLPGLGHEVCDCSGDCHGLGLSGPGDAAADAYGASHAAARKTIDANDCPICQYFSHAQAIQCDTPAPLAIPFLSDAIAATARLCPVRFLAAYDSRGPPA